MRSSGMSIWLGIPTLLVLLLVSLGTVCARDGWDEYQTRDFQTLSGDQVRALAEMGPAEWTDVHSGHLAKLLIPRASGSQNNTLVQKYISSVFSKLGWHEEKTPFTGSTPIGDVDFTNLVYTFDPDAPRKIVIAAHFDSKWFKDFPANQFIGATDSAAPCAMMLDLAEALTPMLASRRDRLSRGQGIRRDGFDEEESAETTIQLLFFDGEEAFHDWTDSDSIYGARHLAELWQDTFLPSTHPLSRRRMTPAPTVLNTIDVLVLLDLLGNDKSTIMSYFRETDWLFDQMADADKRLREANLVKAEADKAYWFIPNRGRKGMIGDDHVPFLQRGVSVLHVISNPFPRVWHTLGDDASVLDLNAMNRWNKILRVFTAEYLGLSPDTDTKNPARQVDELY